MSDFLFPYEKELFLAINGSHSYFLDCVMWIYSGRIIWLPIIVFILFTIIYKKDWRQWASILVLLVILITLCDKISAEVIKPLISRPRPINFPGLRNFVETVNGYGVNHKSSGFVSAHAANAFGFAIFSSLIFHHKAYTWIIFIWASIMAYSRVYLGVHFISDVIGGMLLGLVIGYGMYHVYKFVKNKIPLRHDLLQLASYPEQRISILSIGIVTYITLFSIFSTYIINLNLFK